MSWVANVHKLFAFIREHILAIFFAILISLATGLPQFYVIHLIGPGYQGIFPEVGNDDRYYQARSHEVRDGFPHLGNPYIYELRDAESVSFWMPDAALSYAGKFLGLDVQHTFAFFNFILPPILFLVTYGILLYATDRKIASLLGASFFHIGFFLTTFLRSPSPQLNFLFVELAILAALRLVRNAPFSAVGLGFSLGVLFYVYPYFWTFMYGVVGCFFLVTLLHKDLRDRSLSLFTALALGLLIGLPVLQQTFGQHSEGYRETIFRLGEIYSRTPAGAVNILLCTLTIAMYITAMWYVHSLARDRIIWLFLGGTLGAILAANNQILTGTNLEYSSHYFLPVAYFVFLAFVYLMVLLFEIQSESAVKSYLAIGTIVLVSGITLIGGLLSLEQRTRVNEPLISVQRYGPVLSWLGQHTAPESVVLTGEELSELIAAYTNDRIFYSRNANLHVMTNNEIWTRFVLEYWKDSFDDTFLNLHIGQIWGSHYYDQYGHDVQLNKFRRALGLQPLPAELLPKDVKDTFRSFAISLEKDSPEKLLGDRKIDYAVSSSDFVLPIWLKQVYPNMHPVANFGDITIFELGPKSL